MKWGYFLYKKVQTFSPLTKTWAEITHQSLKKEWANFAHSQFSWVSERFSAQNSLTHFEWKKPNFRKIKPEFEKYTVEETFCDNFNIKQQSQCKRTVNFKWSSDIIKKCLFHFPKKTSKFCQKLLLKVGFPKKWVSGFSTISWAIFRSLIWFFKVSENHSPITFVSEWAKIAHSRSNH